MTAPARTLSRHGQMVYMLIETTARLSRLLDREELYTAAEPPPAGPTPPSELPGSFAGEDTPIEPADHNLNVGPHELLDPLPPVLSFDTEPLPAGELGKKIVAIAQRELARGVKEVYVDGKPGNFDTGECIKKYFVEGPRWKADTWESRKLARGGIGDAWCAAFVSYCWRAAHDSYQLALPISLSASSGELFAQAQKTGRFIPRDGVPSFGDIVFLGSGSSPGHVALFESKSSDGTITIIEGNAGANCDQLCRSHLIPGKPRYERLMGFCAAEAPAPSAQT